MNKTESEKSDKDDKLDKVLFIQRLIAFIIDIFLVSMIVSLIAYPFVDSKSITKLQDGMMDVSEKYMNLEIDANDVAPLNECAPTLVTPFSNVTFVI